MLETARKVTVANGRLRVEGSEGSFLQDPARPLKLEAHALVRVSGHDWREGTVHAAHRIEAQAWVAGASLGRIASDAEAQALALTIRAFPDDGGKPPLLRLGHQEEDEPGDGFTAELFLPQTLFAALLADVEAGRADRLAFSASTNLWLPDTSRTGEPPRFHLGLDADGAAKGHGRVESIEWRPAPPGEPTAEAGAPLAPAADDSAPEADEAVAEALRRINWSIKQLLLVLVFLMLIVALK
jgi:hypothetical protein